MYLTAFFGFLLLAGMALGACVGQFVGMTLFLHTRLEIYALPVGALVGAALSLGVSLAFIVEMNSFGAQARQTLQPPRQALPAAFPRPAGAKASGPQR